MRIIFPLLLLTASLWSPVIFAHSEQSASVPAHGAQLAAPPEMIEIRFDDAMRIISVALTSASGDEYSVESLSGRAATETLQVNPPELPAGDYIFEWRGIARDGHAMSGELSFSVQE